MTSRRTRTAADGASVTTRDLLGTARYILGLLWRADPRRLLGIVAIQTASALGLGAVVLLVHRVLSGAIGSATEASARPYVVFGIAAALVFATLGAIGQSVSQSMQRVLAVETDREATIVVLNAAVSAELYEFERPEFHDRLQRALFASRMQPSMIVMSVAAGLQSILGVLVVSIAFIGVVWWLLPLCLLAFLPIARAARTDRNVRRELQQELAEDRRVREYLERLLAGRDEAKEIRAFGLGDTLRGRWREHVARELASVTSGERRALRRRISGRLAANAIILTVVVLTGTLVGAGLVSLTSALTALVALWMLASRVQSLGYVMNTVGDSMLYLDDLRTFATAGQDANSHPPSAPTEPETAELRADRIFFSYPGATRPSLRGVDITIRPGEVIALVGANGSGKTTLSKLLCGTYQPDAGQLMLDGEPVNDPQALRARSSVLFQDFVRYRLSARDNIAFGRPDIPTSHERLDDAAARSGADAVLTHLTQGSETILAPEYTGGSDLSLGQWQRLALARAFYRDAPLIVLDEPTASLDPDAEAELFDHIRQHLAGRSVVFISHRFSNVRGADRIYVLDSGRVTESGDHETLMRLDGSYARQFRRQAVAYQTDAVDYATSEA